MKIVKLIIVSLFFLLGKSLAAQSEVDVSGIWKGSLSYQNKTNAATLELIQKGTQLEGYISSKSLDGKDSTKKVIKGVITGNQLEILETKYVYRVRMNCKAKIDLEFSSAGGKQQLTGKWSGDMRMSTCPPGVNGPINFERGVQMPQEAPQVVTVKQPQKQVQNKQTAPPRDELGNILVSELSKRRYYSLFIGVNEYADPEIQTLDKPLVDATALSQVLSESYTFNKEDMIFLQNPVRAEIINALDEIAEKATETDNVLIFYAGHGVWNEKLNQGYWLPSDASMDSKAQWLSNSTLRDYLGGIKSKHTLLISDACFSGGILKERSVEQSSKAMLELYKLPSRKAMTSGTMTTVPDESMFIKYLLKNLRQNESKLLSADQLFRNFKIAVINNSPSGLVPQYGVIAFAGDEGGDFIFMRED